MAFITVSGETGCRTEELARAVARRMHFELLSESKIESLIAEEFGGPVPQKAWPAAVTSIVSRLGAGHDLVIAATGSEYLLPKVAGVLRVWVIAREACRSGNLMLDHRTDRTGALTLLRDLELQERQRRKARSGRTKAVPHNFDVTLNLEAFDTEAMAAIVEAAARARGLSEHGLLSGAAEAQLQFQARLQLAKHGIAPGGKAALAKKTFCHPSEEMFAHLLDFYRIAWDYEPRSFPLQWDKDGKITEAFTPDFYLPEFDLYVELTTMKQALVTKKNRKIKLLKAIYPHVNIQVFYQRDFQDLIFKYGLEGRDATSHAN
jgi:cytidylate kinase